MNIRILKVANGYMIYDDRDQRGYASNLNKTFVAKNAEELGNIVIAMAEDSEKEKPKHKHES
jgi:hypothetical protein